MATGYTESIKSGITFEDFVVNCAKAFGAVRMLLDDFVAEIPVRFEPSDYHSKKLSELQLELGGIETMTVYEAEGVARREYDEAVAYNKKQVEECNSLRQKYDTMLVKVMEWQPPTTDHQELKTFMVQQISDSIEFDCRMYHKAVELRTGEQWISTKTQRLLEDIVYYTEKHRAEVEKVGGCNRWLRQLRDSL